MSLSVRLLLVHLVIALSLIQAEADAKQEIDETASSGGGGVLATFRGAFASFASTFYGGAPAEKVGQASPTETTLAVADTPKSDSKSVLTDFSKGDGALTKEPNLTSAVATDLDSTSAALVQGSGVDKSCDAEGNCSGRIVDDSAVSVNEPTKQQLPVVAPVVSVSASQSISDSENSLTSRTLPLGSAFGRSSRPLGGFASLYERGGRHEVPVSLTLSRMAFVAKVAMGRFDSGAWTGRVMSPFANSVLRNSPDGEASASSKFGAAGVTPSFGSVAAENPGPAATADGVDDGCDVAAVLVGREPNDGSVRHTVGSACCNAAPESKATTQAGCCNRCKSNPGCEVFVWQPSAGSCWLLQWESKSRDMKVVGDRVTGNPSKIKIGGWRV